MIHGITTSHHSFQHHTAHRSCVQDVKILCPAALRDTCAILGIHMSQAFSGIRFGAQTAPRRVRTSQMTSSSSNPSTPTHADSAAQAQGTQSSRLSQGGVEALSTGSSFTEGMLSGGVLQRASIARYDSHVYSVMLVCYVHVCSIESFNMFLRFTPAQYM